MCNLFAICLSLFCYLSANVLQPVCHFDSVILFLKACCFSVDAPAIFLTCAAVVLPFALFLRRASATWNFRNHFFCNCSAACAGAAPCCVRGRLAAWRHFASKTTSAGYRLETLEKTNSKHTKTARTTCHEHIPLAGNQDHPMVACHRTIVYFQNDGT